MDDPAPTPQVLPNLQRSAAQLFMPVQKELDRVFDQLSSSWTALTDVGPSPRVDLTDAKDGVELTVELPGMTKADVKITVDGDVVTVSGVKRGRKEIKGRQGRIQERGFGPFERSIPLPRQTDMSKLRATMADGVLTITAPKLAGAAARTIKVQSPG